MEEGSLDGQKIGNYVVVSLLGKGGMGAVYLAKHPEIGREVAIKVLNQVFRPNAAERFIDEARAATRIKHPNIIDIYDLGRTDGDRIYYVMEKLEGRELKALMKEHFAKTGRMSPKEVLPVLAQICYALQAAHDAHVVHRDLKPENIYVLRRKHLALKILDFGLAKLMEREHQGVSRTKTGACMGSPLVIAPEQAAGKPRLISHRTDLYSLGVILFWMLAGRPPFTDKEAWMLMAKHISDAPPLLSDLVPTLPPGIISLVMQCMDKDPAKRPGSAREILTRFSQALGQEIPQDVKDSMDQAWSGKTLPVSSLQKDVAPAPAPDEEFSSKGTTLPTPAPTASTLIPPPEEAGTTASLLSFMHSQPRWVLPTAAGGTVVLAAAVLLLAVGWGGTPDTKETHKTTISKPQPVSDRQAPKPAPRRELPSMDKLPPPAKIVSAPAAEPDPKSRRKITKTKRAPARPRTTTAPVPSSAKGKKKDPIRPDAGIPAPAPAAAPEEDKLKEPNL